VTFKPQGFGVAFSSPYGKRQVSPLLLEIHTGTRDPEGSEKASCASQHRTAGSVPRPQPGTSKEGTGGRPEV